MSDIDFLSWQGQIVAENKKLRALLTMRSAGPYDGSGPCPEIMRLAEENKRLRGDHADALRNVIAEGEVEVNF